MKYKSFILVTYILFSSAGTISAKGKKVISWLDATVKAKTEIQTKLKEKKCPYLLPGYEKDKSRNISP